MKKHCNCGFLWVIYGDEVQSWVLAAGSIPLPTTRQANFLEDNMKSIALAAALSLAATSVFAGSYTAPAMEPTVMVEKASSSSGGGILVPLIVLLILLTRTTPMSS
jgi:hypothetical protein